jgi:hypothetical protein
MTVAAAHDALKAAYVALAAARIIRDERFEELVGAVAAEGWRVVFRHKDTTGHERVVVEHYGGRSAELGDVVAAMLRQGATA